MIGPATERGGLKDSENAPNSIFSKINRTGFWRFGTDMWVCDLEPSQMKTFKLQPT